MRNCDLNVTQAPRWVLFSVIQNWKKICQQTNSLKLFNSQGSIWWGKTNFGNIDLYGRVLFSRESKYGYFILSMEIWYVKKLELVSSLSLALCSILLHVHVS